MGGWLPASLAQTVAAFSSDQAFPTGKKVSFALVRAELARPLAARQRASGYANVAVYPVTAHLPQALAIWCGRSLGASPLVLLYSARLVVLALATALTWIAVRQMPFQRWLTVAAVLTPMAASLRASAAVDGLTNGLAFLLTAMVARRRWGASEERDSWREDLALAAVTIGLLLTKLPYAPLALLLLLIPRSRRPRHAAAIAVAAVLAIAYTASVPRAAMHYVRAGVGVDVGAQMARAVREPIAVGAVLFEDLWRHLPRYAAQAVGAQLGWLEVRLPFAVVLGYLAALALLLASREEVAAEARVPFLAGHRLFLALVATTTALLVVFSQYVTYSPLAASYVEGVQGRYFLPILPAVGLLLRHRLEPLDEVTVAQVSRGIVILATIVAWVCLRAYYWTG
jgi:uncharacterized membrane protein